MSLLGAHPRRHAYAVDPFPDPDGVASRMYRVMSGRGVDLASVIELAGTLDVSTARVCAAAEAVPVLGLCGAGRESMVFCLPPEPLAAGFVAERRGGRLMLRLPERGASPTLLLSGLRIGPVPLSERDETVGSGELAHLVSRLTLMAASWLPPATVSPTGLLFELIALAWRSGPPTGRGIAAELWVSRVDFAHPIAHGYSGATHRLALVTHRRNGVHQLVNVYPEVAGR